MADKRLAVAATVLGLLALTAGGLQLWAFVASDRPRHVVLAVFALAVGISVLVAATRALRHATRKPDDVG
jgi:ABC-type transport system involved in cytochrome c biogenesis permease component